MTNKDFIDRLNDIIFNYGYIIIDVNNYEYYFKKFHINYNISYMNPINRYKYRYKLFSVNHNNFMLGFKSLKTMILSDGLFKDSSFKSIYDFIKFENKCRLLGCSPCFTDKFIDFILSIEGTSKEEILLKIQMLGY